MYDNENRDFCSMSLVSFHVFPYGNKPSISVHTKKKKNKTKIGSLRYRLKKMKQKKQQECTFGSHCENEWQSSRKPISTIWRNT